MTCSRAEYSVVSRSPPGIRMELRKNSSHCKFLPHLFLFGPSLARAEHGIQFLEQRVRIIREKCGGQTQQRFVGRLIFRRKIQESIDVALYGRKVASGHR